ncbi:MAG: cysteine desulfurase [Winogradskyella sp.]|uniref:cysteine desulfurase family protein n=1 Tax=Winogradskyella sp. TaxID=1883156 RepID=UPI001826EBEC|nr:cysteine desulfurase family protein [Winogradskyella sp.]MBT8244176.1 cysteine desulfurase [Winogradskyella sp.]NNK23179.1 cysteine desulfurase [Winogradskyella sp.]
MTNMYFDSAATTQLRPEVVAKMTEVLNQNFGNPSSTHSYGRSAKAIMEQCRKNIASYFNVSAAEIIFTSGGTEADNLAMRSAVRDLGVTEIITSRIEHHAVLHTALQLQSEYDIDVTYVQLDEKGTVDFTHFEELLKSDSKKLVSLMHINNEIGNILDIKRVAQLCNKHDALFHTDTVQSVGHFNIDLQEIPLDFLAASAHKFHGPKGVGFCFVRAASGLKPLIFGGEQERGYRAGTESLHNIVGLDEALKIAYQNLEEESTYIKDLKQYFVDSLTEKLPNCHFNGECCNPEKSTYTLLNVCLPLPPEKAAMLQFQLDLKGIACSKGSACQSGSAMASHVLTEILQDDLLKRPSVRFSLSKYNTKEEIDYVVQTLCEFAKS